MASESVGNAYLNVVPKIDGDAKSIGNKFGSELSGGAKAALGAGAVAMGNILSNAISSAASVAGEQLSKTLWNYADYEQLVGGVDTLFKESSAIVQANAQQAFKTAGMSANEYMEQVTSFSASLLQGLGGDTEAAAAYADMAMRDMSDNANKMGTDMESITNAYQGFAKQNYTMLDNLKLGYGGTKSEMERLLKDAGEIAGVEFDIDNYQDVIEAIHVMQESMGITGTTMEEGASTISGSINQLHGAWENFLTAIGDGGESMDLSEVTHNLIESLGAVASNVIPAIGRIFGTIALQLPQIIGEALMSMIPAVHDALVNLFGKEAGDAFVSFIDAVMNVKEAVTQAFEFIKNTIMSVMPVILSAVVPVVQFIMQAIQTAISVVMPIIQGVIDFLQANVLPIVQEVMSFIQATIMPVITDIVTAIQDNMPVIQEIFTAVTTTIGSVVETVWPAIQGIIVAVMDAIHAVVSTVWPVVKDIITNVFNTIKGIAEAVWPAISGAVQTAASIIRGAIDGIGAIVGTVTNIFNAVKDAITNPIETAKQAISDAVNAIKGFFENLHIEIPLPKIPEITIDGGEAPWGIGGQGRLPSFDVHWAALGAFVNKPTLLGAGEAGTEMILPKSGGLMNDFADAVTAKVGNDAVVNKLDEIERNLGYIIATYTPTATPRDLKRINQKVSAYA